MASEASTPSWRVRVGLCVAVLVSLALRLPRMTQSVWYDEYCRTDAVLRSGRLWELLLHDVHNPMYNAFMWAWTGVFGDSDVSIRVPSLVAGYASLALFGAYLRRRAGVWAAAGVVVWGLWSPAHVWYSTEAKNNMWMLAMATLALWGVDRFVERATWGRAAWACAGLLGAFYTDLVGLLVIVPLVVWMGAEGWRRARAGDASLARRGAVVVLVVGAAVTPWCVFKLDHVQELWRGYLEPFRPREVSELLGGAFVQGHGLVPDRPWKVYASIGGMVLVAPLLALGARRLWRRAETRVLVLLMAGGVAGMAVTSAVVDALYEGRDHFIYQPRNLLCVLYVFGAVLWSGVERVGWAPARRALACGVCALGLAGSVAMQTLHAEKFTLERARPDWRAMAGVLERDAGGAAAVVVSRSPVKPLVRYAAGELEVVCTWGAACGVAELAGAAREGRRLYYADDGAWWGVTPAEVDGWRAAYEVREVARLGRVTLFRLERRGD
jgi:4-amino-4-deoxy-L-arabinose transferase-like glycosyltransferase